MIAYAIKPLYHALAQIRFSLPTGKVCTLLCRLLIGFFFVFFFFKNQLILKNSFRKTIRVSNGLDPSLGPTVCKGYQQMKLVCKELKVEQNCESVYLIIGLDYLFKNQINSINRFCLF